MLNIHKNDANDQKCNVEAYNSTMSKVPMVINITGKVPGTEDSHELQSIYPLNPFILSLGDYLARSLQGHGPITIEYFQEVINKRACDADELTALSFEPNQRIGELIALASFTAAVNKINEQHKSGDTDFMPAWQKPGQNESIEKFTGKGSWDGFIYKHVPLGKEDPALEVVMTGVEVKSLMINPKTEFNNLNTLLGERMSQFSKHFQIEGSIGVVLVPPYSRGPNAKISFDLKQATDDVNKGADKVTCALVFIRNETKDDATTISTLTYFVSKNPKIVNDNIDRVEMVRVPFCKFKNTLS
jgi:hypothetical protein